MNHNISGTQIVVQNFIDIFVHTFAVILIDCAYLREREREWKKKLKVGCVSLARKLSYNFFVGYIISSTELLYK